VEGSWPDKTTAKEDKECCKTRTATFSSKDLKTYLGRPVCNSPEMMPWDCSLNKDLKDAVMRHVCYTCHLPEEERVEVLLVHSQAWILGLPTNPGARRWLAKQRVNPLGCPEGLSIDGKDPEGERVPHPRHW
jgi:hypothetical protein